MIRVRIQGVGAWGPGFDDWPTLSAHLQDPASGELPATNRPAPTCIPPRERRRSPLAVKLAVEVAQQACEMADLPPSEAACLFAAGMGDMDITDYLCRTLAADDPMVSPTKFHNSVHNAPVGVWTISQSCHQASSAVSAFTHSVPASLLEAAIQASVEDRAVVWVCQDIASAALA